MIEKKVSKKKKKFFKNRKVFWSTVSSIVVIFLIGAFLFLQYVLEGLPSLEQLENPKPQLASNVFSADGELIGSFFRQNRIEANIDSIPKSVVNALVSTEDRKFYDHWGVDLERFIKAMIKNVFLFRREGASTITQQLAKNLYDLKNVHETLFDTIVRKIREWITSAQIERTYTKQEILEMYFNISYFGNRAYGIEMAAKVYFNKKVQELTVPEAAVLVALLKSSVYYDPTRHYDRSLQRRNLVMYNMVQTGMLSEEDYEKYKKQPIDVNVEKIAQGSDSEIAPHFVEYIRQQMERMSNKYGYDLYEDGLTIYTTLDSRMQKIATRDAIKHVNEFQKQFDRRWSWRGHRDILNDLIDKAIKNTKDYKRAANRQARTAVYDSLKRNIAFVDSVQKDGQKIELGFVVLDVKTGGIKAMVGGRDQNSGYGLNHSTQIRRQPGSSFKPIIYTVAIDNGLYPAYPIINQPFDYNGWEPQNFSKEVGGFLTLREGLLHSVNLIAARLIIEGHVELWQVGRYADRMGIKSKLDLYPSIALGTSAVTPLEMASAYATLANKGIYNEPISILKIEDKDGVIIDNFYSNTREAISEETAYIMDDMLQSVMNSGTGVGVRTRYNFHRPAGGKTGTTQEYADTWFVGFTPQLSAATWVGFDDHRVKFTGDYGQGARAALPIWAMFMKDTYDSLDLPLEDFEPPSSGNVVPVKFCKETIYDLGDPKLYSDDCKTGVVTDIINLKDIPPTYNAERDTTIKLFDKYMIVDSMAHEAKELE